MSSVVEPQIHQLDWMIAHVPREHWLALASVYDNQGGYRSIRRLWEDWDERIPKLYKMQQERLLRWEMSPVQVSYLEPLTKRKRRSLR